MINTNSSTGVATRCQFQFSDGRSCRMLRSPVHSFFCAFHARQELQLLESQRLGDKISSSLNGDFLTATDINHVLGKLFIAVAQNRIPLRKATALALLGKALLSSLPLVKQEFQFHYKFEHWKKVVANAAPLSSPPSLTDSSLECPLNSLNQTPLKKNDVDDSGLQTGITICQEPPFGESSSTPIAPQCWTLPYVGKGF